MRRLDWRYLVGALVLLAVLVYYSGPDVAQMTYALVLLDLATAVVAIVRGARRRQYGLLAGAQRTPG